MLGYLKLHDDENKHTINIANVEKVGKNLGIRDYIIDAKTLFQKEHVYDAILWLRINKA